MSEPLLITGAASGIGAATVAAYDGPVIAVDRDECDLADPAAVEALIGRLGPLAGVVHCAGIPGTAPPARILRVNLLAPRRLSLALRERIVPGGAVINVASIAAGRSDVDVDPLLDGDDDAALAWLDASGLDGTATYDLSKKALVALALRQCADWLGTGVRSLSVSPGPTTTPILTDFEATMGADRMQASSDLVGGHATPEDVGAVIAFLAGARWVNGVDVRVDGGLIGARQAVRPG